MADVTELFPDGTDAFLRELVRKPDAVVRCSVCVGSAAMMAFVTPHGCVARPHDRFQALCAQHIETDGMIGSVTWLMDLSPGETWMNQDSNLPLHRGYSMEELDACLTGLTQQVSE